MAECAPSKLPKDPISSDHVALHLFQDQSPGLIKRPTKVVNGKVTDDYVYMDAAQEEKYIISQSDIDLDDDRRIMNETIFARERE